MTMIRWIGLFMSLFFSFFGYTTSIIPYQNLGVLAEHSDAVGLFKVVDYYAVNHETVTHFEYALQAQTWIKGESSHPIMVRRASKSYEDGDLQIQDDLDLQVGETYLLFLYGQNEQYFLPKVLNYYVFQQEIIEGHAFLVPNATSRMLKPRESSEFEACSTLDKETFISHMTSVVNKRTTYNPEVVKAPLAYNRLEERAKPSYCTYLGNPQARWQLFDGGGTLPIYADATPDADNPDSHVYLQNAINGLNSGYGGDVSLSYGGTFSVNLDNCTNGVNPQVQGLGLNSIIVVFNDPCNEISPFDCNSGGTLGFGGLYYSSSTHPFNGEDWNSGAYGYVVINNGLSCFTNSSNWQSLLMHELTHSLGLGHIDENTNPGALMNPNCCNGISIEDQSCVAHAYNASLPVQLIAFDATPVQDQVSITWQTSWEVDHDHFEVLRSTDGDHWESISIVDEGQVVNENQKKYQSLDPRPAIGINYYQLKQVDIDGQFDLSNIVQVPYYPARWAQITPNPVRDGELRLELTTTGLPNWELHIMDVTGIVRKTIRVQGSHRYFNTLVDVHELGAGVYFIRFPKQTGMEPIRFVKH